MAGRLSFRLEWESAPGVTDAADAATWSRLEVRFTDGEVDVPLTRVYDESGAVRLGVYGAALPLAEWLVSAWFHVVEGRRLPDPAASRNERYEWLRVHAWRYGSDGMAVPNLRFVPDDDDHVKLEWRADPATRTQRVAFMENGEGRIPRELLENNLATFINHVATRLREQECSGPRATGFMSMWDVVRASGSEANRRMRNAALLGITIDDVDDVQGKALVDAMSIDMTPLAELLLEAGGPPAVRASMKEAEDLAAECEKAPAANSAWLDMRSAVARRPISSSEAPWIQGWSAARHYRSLMSLPDDQPVPDGDLGATLGLRERWLGLDFVDSIVVWKGGRAPIRAHRPRERVPDLRFANARDLYAVLLEGSVESGHQRVFSARLAGSSVARAFAAELVAPVEAVRRALTSNAVTIDDLADVASGLRSPLACVVHQVENHSLGRIRDRY